MKSFKIAIIAAIAIVCSCAPKQVKPDVVTGLDIGIFPDYTGVTLPVSIAPINFEISQTAQEYYVEFENTGGEKIIINSQTPQITIPQSEWSRFAQNSASNGNGDFKVTITLLKDGKWYAYNPFKCSFSDDKIDSHIAYRLLHPGYVLWNKMGIYQRELSSFDEQKIADNTANNNGCMNCHTFCNNSAQDMMLHIRKSKGGTVVVSNGKAQKYKMQTGKMYADAVYPSWSRDGRYIAFSSNNTKQLFHIAGDKPVDVFDLQSEIVVFDTRTEQMISDTAVFSTKYWETFPEWSSDGKYLYFCRADSVGSQAGKVYKSRYDLCRIGFDPNKGEFTTQVEVVYPAAEHGKSVTFPRISPDGRFMVFTLSDYGTFSIWHKESDLYLMDMETGVCRAIDEINSDDVDSYHCWSSDGNWMVFSSKRIDGRWARPFITHFDREKAEFGKPFVVPQKSANYYDNQMYTYNIPQFVNGKVNLSHEILDAIQGDAKPVTAGGGL